MSAVAPPAVGDALVRASLGVLAVSQGSIGVWALVGPASFFTEFPGGGHAWVSVLPPYNEHLTRDVGALSLALAIVLAVAAVRSERGLSRLAVLAVAAYAVPHTVFHALHLEHLPTSDAIAQTVGFALQLLLVALVVAGTRISPHTLSDSHPSPRPTGALTPGDHR